MTKPSEPTTAADRLQQQRAAMADTQYVADGRLKQVLTAWGHGPEFIESLLSWGYRIEAEARQPDSEALRLALEQIAATHPEGCGECGHIAFTSNDDPADDRLTLHWGRIIESMEEVARAALAALQEQP